MKVDPPKFKVNQKVKLSQAYTFRIDEVLVKGEGMYSYRGQMFKDGRMFNYGVSSEKSLMDHLEVLK